MSDAGSTVYFDFIDPVSYLLARELAALGADVVAGLAWHPFELRPPPTPLVTIDDASLAGRWREARERARAFGVIFDPPELVPWTRKAHELVLHAGDHDAEDAVHDAEDAVHDADAAVRDVQDAVRRRIFEAYLLEGRDIGRVDVLVALAVDLGLDRTETKAVLDVDTHQATVASLRAEAADRGVTDTPTVVQGGKRLEGFHNRDALGTLLGTPR